MSAKRNDGANATSSIFPLSKIKARILRDEGVGQLSKNSISSISACSATFIKTLAEEAAAQNSVLTLDMVQNCVKKEEKYDFLRESIGNVKEESVPHVKKRKRASQGTKPRKQKGAAKNESDAPELSSAPVKQAIANAQKAPALSHGGIVLDEDDYD